MARTAWNQPRAKRSSNRKAVMAKRTFTAPRSRSAYSNLPTNQGTNPQRLLIHRGVGFPDRFRTKLQFCESFVLTGFGTTITQQYGVRMNGAYDPVLGLGGGQPTYFDQFAGIYGRYNVVGAKLTARYALPLTTTVGDGPYMIGITGTSGNGIVSTDAPTAATAPNTNHTLLMNGGDPKVLTATYSARQLSAGDSGDDYASSANNSTPSVVWNSIIWASPQGVSTAGSVNVVFTIEYIVDWYQLLSVVDL